MEEPRKFTIKELFASANQFRIPTYQRGYDWKGDAQVKDLFGDLTDSIESKFSNNLFLGTMIFDIGNRDAKDQVEIIDGQQRFTTILITLIAARNFARNILQDVDLAHAIQPSVQSSDPFSDTKCEKLFASETVADVIRVMSQFEWDGGFPDSVEQAGTKIKKSIKRQVARVEPIYKFAFSQIIEYCEGNSKTRFKQLMSQIYDKTFIIRIDVKEKDEAFEIFERTNARGKALEVSDLLKNFLFSKNKEILDFDAEQIWDEISSNSGSNILRVLKYFWISRKGYVASRDLYRNLRTYAADIGVNEFVVDLRAFSEFYRAFNSDHRKDFPDWLAKYDISKNEIYSAEITRSIAALNLFRVTQPLPFIFACLDRFRKIDASEKKIKKIINLLRCIESFHYINNRICNRIGNEVERIYATYSDRVFNEIDFYKVIDSFLIEILGKSADRAEFVARFELLSYQNLSDRQTIRYAFDRLVNIGVKEGQRVYLLDFFDGEQGIQGSYNIDHIACQALNSDAGEVMHEIGNLLILPKQINGILGADDFPVKMAKLAAPHKFGDNNIKHVPNWVAEFVEEARDLADWNEEMIKRRTQSLAEAAYQEARYEYHY